MVRFTILMEVQGMPQPNFMTETFPNTEPEIVRLGAEVRGLVTRAIKRSGKNAAQVVQEMSERLGGRPITASTIYELTRNGDPHQPREVRMPVTWVITFCEVTRDDGLQRFLMGPRLRTRVEHSERVQSLDWILEEIRKYARK